METRPPTTSLDLTQKEPGGPKDGPLEVPEPGNFRSFAFVAVIAALLLVLHEISALSAGFLTETGTYISFNELGSPTAWSQRQHWRDDLTVDQLDSWRSLLRMYQVVDAMFIVAYTWALLRLARWLGDGARTLPIRLLRYSVLALAAVDALEVVGQGWIGLERQCEDGSCIPAHLEDVVAIVSTTKWLLVAATAVAVVAATTAAGKHFWRRVWEIRGALWIQRFSLLAFLPVAVLAVFPLGEWNNLFDQLPDVQRAWLDGWPGPWHAIAAALVYTLWVLPWMFALGRIRSDWAVRRAAGGTWWPFFDGPGRVGPRLQNPAYWAAGPAIVVALAIVVEFWQGGTVSWWRVAAFCAIPMAVLAADLLLPENIQPRDLPVRDNRWARNIMVTGDFLAVTAIALTGLGLIRAFTGLWALDHVGIAEAPHPGWALVLIFLGFAIAVLPWPAARPVLVEVHAQGLRSAKRLRERAEQATQIERAEQVEQDSERPRARAWREQSEDARLEMLRVMVPGLEVVDPGVAGHREAAQEDPRLTFRQGFMFVAICLFIAMSWWPRWFADKLGALAAATLTLGTLVLMLGILVAYAQDRQPPKIFKLIRFGRFKGLKATPIILLLFLAVSITPLAGKPTDVHPVSSKTQLPESGRPDLTDAFKTWFAQDDPCVVPFEPNPAFTLRPMLMIGAEGGGIRAAYWTAAGLDRIRTAGKDGCGRRAALFSAGASGGAVALTVGRFSDEPLAAVDAMSGHEALGAAVVSLASSDLLASATGVRFAASLGEPDRESGEPAWERRSDLDRAGLMEVAWEGMPSLAGLRTNFLPDDPDDAYTFPGSITGQLILTSTASRDGCRALLSQIDLGEGATYDGSWPDCGDGGAGDNSYDVFDAYGRTSADDGDHCLGNVPALTIATLSSRFPYVTPSGIVGECRNLEPSQLVDGGYVDNTGLGTIVDLAPRWQELVRTHNDAVLAARGGTIIVPKVVYLENGTGEGYEAEPGSEEDVPVAADTDDWWRPSWTMPETLVVPFSKWNSGDHRVYTHIGLTQARKKARDALCDDGEQNPDDPLPLTCTQLLASKQVEHPVYVIHQSTQPSMQAPLGWVMSSASQADLDSDMQHQAENGMAELPNDPATQSGYSSLADLLEALGG